MNKYINSCLIIILSSVTGIAQEVYQERQKAIFLELTDQTAKENGAKNIIVLDKNYCEIKVDEESKDKRLLFVACPTDGCKKTLAHGLVKGLRQLVLSHIITKHTDFLSQNDTTKGFACNDCKKPYKSISELSKHYIGHCKFLTQGNNQEKPQEYFKAGRNKFSTVTISDLYTLTPEKRFQLSCRRQRKRKRGSVDGVYSDEPKRIVLGLTDQMAKENGAKNIIVLDKNCCEIKLDEASKDKRRFFIACPMNGCNKTLNRTKVYALRQSVLSHIITKHTDLLSQNDTTKDFACNDCKKPHKALSELSKHYIVHCKFLTQGNNQEEPKKYFKPGPSTIDDLNNRLPEEDFRISDRFSKRNKVLSIDSPSSSQTNPERFSQESYVQNLSLSEEVNILLDEIDWTSYGGYNPENFLTADLVNSQYDYLMQDLGLTLEET